jgi:hypothetical protein
MVFTHKANEACYTTYKNMRHKEICMDKLRFPYGRADFYRLITNGDYYVDRTTYIRLLEEKGDTLLFLRPRRFGKSLLLSLLENYYDVNKADDFVRLFGHLAIGKNPTPRHNQYLILFWDFSTVDSYGTSDTIRQSLYNSINRSIDVCRNLYADLIPTDILIDPSDALNSFQSLLAAVRTTPYALYLLVDEYDNFANEVFMALQSGSTERYQHLVEGEGIIKTVFKLMKFALGGLRTEVGSQGAGIALCQVYIALATLGREEGSTGDNTTTPGLLCR